MSFLLIKVKIPRFKEGDYNSAIEHYTAALRQNPMDAKLLSNRAAAYQKIKSIDGKYCLSSDESKCQNQNGMDWFCKKESNFSV